MTEWMIRVLDVRQKLLTRGYVRAKVEPWFTDEQLRILSGPNTVFHAKGSLPGEWAFQIEDRVRRSEREVHALLSGLVPQADFRLLTLDRATPLPAKRRHLRPVADPTPPSGIPKPRANSPYDMISEPLPYAGDTR